jgi:hypothetical protein
VLAREPAMGAAVLYWIKESLYFIVGSTFAKIVRWSRRRRGRAADLRHEGRQLILDIWDVIRFPGLVIFLVTFIAIFFASTLPPSAPLPKTAFVAASCALAITIADIILHLITRSKAAQQHTESVRRLTGKCQPDGAPFNAAVVIRGATWSDRENFLNEFWKVPHEAKSVVLVLQQTPSAKFFFSTPHAYESMRRQLEARNSHETLKKIKVDWVCFENRFNRVVAYMRYDRFERDILVEKNTSYAELLRITSPSDFKKFLDTHIQYEKEQKETAVTRPNTIQGLAMRIDSYERSKLDIFSRMIDRGENDLLLASVDRKRLGLVTFMAVTKSLFDVHIYKGDELRRLNEAISEWEKDSTEISDKIDGEIIQPSPPVTGAEYPDAIT